MSIIEKNESRPRPLSFNHETTSTHGDESSFCAVPNCAICDSPNTELIGIFMERNTPVKLFYCVECQSFSSPFAPIQPISNSTSWHLKVQERNRGFSRDLLGKIGIEKPIILDIGCGIGTLIEIAHELGGGGIGYDLNPAAIAYGQDSGLDLRCEFWGIDSVHPKPTLITCVMVLEHIHHPRDLLRDLILASSKYDAPLFISVPWFNQRLWKYLDEPVVPGIFHPLASPAVHVSHFSDFAFDKVVRSFGITEIKLIRGGWTGFLIK